LPKPRKFLSWSSLPLQSRTTSRLPALRSRCVGLRLRRLPSKLGIVSRGVLAPSSTTTPGAPFLTHPGCEAGAGRVRVATLPPVPSSGFLPLSTVLAAHAARTNPLRSPPFAVAPRRFAALFHAARAPGVALQSFPFSRSRTRSRGPPASLRVRVRPTQRRGTNRGIRGPFPQRADLSPQLARRLAGLEGRDDGSLESLGHCASPVAGLVCSALVSNRPGSPDTAAGTPASKLCSPRESVPFSDHHPGQGMIARSVLSWAFAA